MKKKYMKPAIRIVALLQRMSLLVDSLDVYNEKGSQFQFSRESSFWDDGEEK